MPPKKLIYQLKITLKGSKPPIWRTIQVPSTCTFWDLHSVIQDVFAWNNGHLHLFTFKDKSTGIEKTFGMPSEEDYYDDIRILPGWKHKISKYLNPFYPTMK